MTRRRPAAALPHAPRVTRLAVGAAAAWLALAVLAPSPAHAVPSFAQQTGLTCSTCHVGAFGPQLTEYGREFKLTGYTLTGGEGFRIPLAAMALGSFTHTAKGQPGGAAQHFGSNDNFALDQASLFYAGKVVGELGAFVQATYDGVARDTFLDNTDIRYAHSFDAGKRPLVLGVDLNNNPTVQDLWNTTPAWSYPFAASALAPTPAAAPLIAGGLAQLVAGLSAYARWDDQVYAEVGGYLSPGHDFLTRLGEHDTAGELKTVAPYWRLAYERQFGSHVVEVGTFGLHAPLKSNRTGPGGDDNYTDLGLDASYQFLGDRHTATVNAAWIHERAHLDASERLGAAGKAGHDLDDLMLTRTYYYRQTYGATLSLFDIFGTKDTTLYGPGAVGGSRTGSPASSGVTLEADWVPFGKQDSWLNPYLNLKLGAQLTHYFEFNGSSSNYDGSGRDATDNDTVFLFAWLAF
jgi:hypothetical protein